jgi:hypothetical protein
MTLRFPNPSRSFDATKNCVQFWGYDSAIEVTFFIEANALKMLCPGVDSVESGFLKAYDSAMTRIHEAANKAYTRGRSFHDAYNLAVEDF